MNGNGEKKDQTWVIALSGFFGGTAPSLAHMVSMLQNDQVPHATFYLGALVMGILGAGLVLVAKENIAWKAFSQGLSAPTIFSSAGTVAVAVAMTTGPVNFIPSAYADPVDSLILEEKEDSVNVTVIPQRGKSFYITEGDRVFKISKRDTIRVPVGKEMTIEDKESAVSYYPMVDDTITVQIREKKAQNHFLRGLFPLMQQQDSRNIQIRQQEQVQEDK